MHSRSQSHWSDMARPCVGQLSRHPSEIAASFSAQLTTRGCPSSCASYLKAGKRRKEKKEREKVRAAFPDTLHSFHTSHTSKGRCDAASALYAKPTTVLLHTYAHDLNAQRRDTIMLSVFSFLHCTRIYRRCSITRVRVRLHS
mmetsp:Transcript_25218/g.63280  ORF Transcript_25218/g.63280 Transcript_25218/m.63280 type:complete len:143 (-) Transcript_25218:581-1009(-)